MAAKDFSKLQRIKRELEDVIASEETDKCGISVEVTNENLTQLKGNVLGPPGSPYEGANFDLDIKIPEDYPFKPLTIRFLSKIWHPNIRSHDGKICLDTLGTSWTPSLTLRTVLLSLQALLAAAEPDDPLDIVVARQYKRDPELFRRTAQHWAQVYAGAPGSDADFEGKIRKLVSVGMGEERAREVLSFCDWDVQRAADVMFIK